MQAPRPEAASRRPWPLAAFERTIEAMSAAGTLLVILVMVLMDADVLGRALFSAPVAGVPEIVTMSLAAIVFLQFPAMLRAGRVIGTDGFLGYLARRAPRAEQWLQAVFHALGAVVFAVLGYAVWPLLTGTWTYGDQYGVQGLFTFPKWPVQLIIVASCVGMTIQYALFAFRFGAAATRAERLELDVDPAERILS